MGEILFIAHRIPFPPDRGDRIRSHHVLKALARVAPVHVACLADDARDCAGESELSALAASYCLVRRTRPLVLAGLQALTRGLPVSLSAFFYSRLAEYVDHVLATRPISAVYVFSGQMGQYVPADYPGRMVMDFVDVDSAKFEAYAHARRWPMRWIHARENRLLRNEEARLAGRADHSVLISAAEASLFGLRLTPQERGGSRIVVIGNGIDSDAFDPAAVMPDPAMTVFGSPRLIFTGQMDYPPNVAAAIRAAERIMPRVRARWPQASLHIVGRNPAAALAALDGKNGVRIWGGVDDIRTWLKAADIALVPLDIARGVQNKVLEAMAMALPVVLSSGAATGIMAVDGKHFQVADDDDALAAAVIALAGDPDRARALGLAARRQVTETATWDSALSGLPELLGFRPEARCHAA